MECNAECDAIHKDMARHRNRAENTCHVVGVRVVIFVVVRVALVATHPMFNEVKN